MGGGGQLGVVGSWLRDRQGVEFRHCPRLVAGLWVMSHIWLYNGHFILSSWGSWEEDPHESL